MEERKKLEIINGDGSNLKISPAYDHLNAGTPKSSDEKPENIVVPKEHKKKDDKKDNEKDNKK